eukprot:1144200-Pelagomonas_calceolata.AAC.10
MYGLHVFIIWKWPTLAMNQRVKECLQPGPALKPKAQAPLHRHAPWKCAMEMPGSRCSLLNQTSAPFGKPATKTGPKT